MGVLTIPLRTDLTHYAFQVDLENGTYGLELRWNERDEGWYLTLSDIDGAPLISGRRVCLDIPLLIRPKTAGLPPGQLLAIDTTGDGLEPGLNDLGGRVQLVYFESTEFPITDEV